MDTISYTNARSNLSKTMNKVCENHAPIIITRANSKPVVMMSLEDFKALEETNYLMRSRKNALRLIDSINEIESMITGKKLNNMEPIYSSKAQEDRNYWAKHNQKILKRIDKLIDDIKLNPYAGIGKPEPLKFEKSGYWSRRINQEHRLVYKVVDQQLYIAQCRYHY